MGFKLYLNDGLSFDDAQVHKVETLSSNCQVGVDLEIWSIWHMYAADTLAQCSGPFNTCSISLKETTCVDCLGPVPASESLSVLRGCCS